MMILFFIDAGTTTAAMIDFIYDNVRATFVTNGIVHAKKLIQKGLKAYIIGGQIKTLQPKRLLEQKL